MKKTGVVLFVGMGALLVFQQTISAAPRYTFQTFAPTSASEDNIAEALNNLGVGTGRMGTGSITLDRAIVVQNGTTQMLGTLPSAGFKRYSEGYEINDLGDVVGESSFGPDSSPRAFLYSNGVMQNLGTLGGSTSSAYGINNSRQVVGRSSTPSSGFVPVLWQNGAALNLGTLGGNDGLAFSINEAGHVVGASKINANDTRAFFFSDRNGNGQSNPGDMINLGTINDFRDSIAEAVNNLDQVVGRLTNGTTTRGFYWSDTNGNHISDVGEMVQLPTLFNTPMSYPKDINLTGDIVGYSRNLSNNPTTDLTPTLWTNGGVYDLNLLINLLPGQSTPLLDTAVAINDAGQILVHGHVPTGLGNKARIYLLTPVPEPSSLVLLILASVGLIAVASRRRRKTAA